MNLQKAKILFLTARPQTLTAAIAPVLVGFFMALRLNPYQMDWRYIFPITMAALCIQIATNFFNDYLDFFKGNDKEGRLGPTRVTAAGLVPPNVVKYWALFFCLLALVFGVPLVIRGGMPFLILGLVCIAMTYLYTGTKFSLAYTGMADLFVIAFFGCVAVWGTYYLLTLQHNPWTLLVGFQLGALCNVILLVNNLRDHKQDQENNKKTLVVRFGRMFALYELLVLVLIAFAGILFWGFMERPFILFIFTLPILIRYLTLWDYLLKNQPSESYNKKLKVSALLYLGYAMVVSLGFCII